MAASFLGISNCHPSKICRLRIMFEMVFEFGSNNICNGQTKIPMEFQLYYNTTPVG